MSTGVRYPDPLAPLGDWLAERMPAVKNALLSPAVGRAAGQAVAGEAGGAVGEAVYGAIGSKTSDGGAAVVKPDRTNEPAAERVRLSADWAVRLPDGAVAVIPAGTGMVLVRDYEAEVEYRWGNVGGTLLERVTKGASSER